MTNRQEQTNTSTNRKYPRKPISRFYSGMKDGAIVRKRKSKFETQIKHILPLQAIAILQLKLKLPWNLYY